MEVYEVYVWTVIKLRKMWNNYGAQRRSNNDRGKTRKWWSRWRNSDQFWTETTKNYSYFTLRLPPTLPPTNPFVWPRDHTLLGSHWGYHCRVHFCEQNENYEIHRDDDRKLLCTRRIQRACPTLYEYWMRILKIKSVAGAKNTDDGLLPWLGFNINRYRHCTVQYGTGTALW